MAVYYASAEAGSIATPFSLLLEQSEGNLLKIYNKSPWCSDALEKLGLVMNIKPLEKEMPWKDFLEC